jgi:5S rRNA maturation endonuclease (ribonuclease M5)
MNKENIIKIAKYLNADTIKEGTDYIMFNCPFAKVLHKHGRDKHPSFGIFSGDKSAYNCFSCGVHGRLLSLPSALSMVYKKDFSKLSKFIRTHEKKLLTPLKEKEDLQLISLPMNKINVYKPLLTNWNFINVKTLALYDIRSYGDVLVIPIYYYHKELIGIKYRNEHYFETDGNFKKYGAFFGMHIPLDPDEPLFIVEGERDVMYLKQFGIRNVWGLSGSLSKKQINTLKKIGNPIVLFLDNDEAGENFFGRLVHSLNTLKEVYYVKEYFGYKDPADLYEVGLLGESLKSISSIMSLKTLSFILTKD